MGKIKLPITGGCQCGQLRFEITKMPATLYCCHCTECQAQSASAFGTSLRVSGTAVKTTGNLSSYVRDRGKANEVECLFCPDCGTRVIHRRDALDASYSIKAGSLDTKLDPVGHIWTASKQNWLVLNNDSLIYETQPDDDYASLIKTFQDRYG